jgi:fatty acid desaturase
MWKVALVAVCVVCGALLWIFDGVWLVWVVVTLWGVWGWLAVDEILSERYD